MLYEEGDFNLSDLQIYRYILSIITMWNENVGKYIYRVFWKVIVYFHCGCGNKYIGKFLFPKFRQEIFGPNWGNNGVLIMRLMNTLWKIGNKTFNWNCHGIFDKERSTMLGRNGQAFFSDLWVPVCKQDGIWTIERQSFLYLWELRGRNWFMETFWASEICV